MHLRFGGDNHHVFDPQVMDIRIDRLSATRQPEKDIAGDVIAIANGESQHFPQRNIDFPALVLVTHRAPGFLHPVGVADMHFLIQREFPLVDTIQYVHGKRNLKHALHGEMPVSCNRQMLAFFQLKQRYTYLTPRILGDLFKCLE